MGAIFSPKPTDIDLFLVSHLIDQNSRDWDRQLVNSIFLPFEAEQICIIPISRKMYGDVLFQPWEKKHNYYVRSAYHLAQNKHTDSGIGSSKDKYSRS